MFNDFDKNIMLKFLTNNYPVKKIKDNKRFKRVVTSHDGQKYFLSLSHTQDELRRHLSQVLNKLFACDDSKFISMVLDNFSPTRQKKP
jgi:hypothetical protein